MDIPNPKRSAADHQGRSGWYPFYPGFSSEFANWALDTFSIRNAGLFLDPWNGAGTSTSAAAARGMQGIGVDLNPAMVVAAKARLVDPADQSSLKPLAHEIVRRATSASRDEARNQDPLCAIAASTAANAVRQIERAIFRILISEEPGDDRPAHASVRSMSPLAAFYYLALFRVVRELNRRGRSKNPVWTRVPSQRATKVRSREATITRSFIRHVELMLESEQHGRPSIPAEAGCVQVEVGTSVRLDSIADNSVDLVLTSPPYCTRLDYAIATLGELLVLGYDYQSSFRALRAELMGTTTVQKTPAEVDSNWGSACTKFLKAVRSHESFASATYYYKNHSQYFRDLYKSIDQISRKLRVGGVAVLVAQDSHYKEIHNDLPRVIQEMASLQKLPCIHREDFERSNPLAASNPKARKYRALMSAVESVLIFEKRD